MKRKITLFTVLLVALVLVEVTSIIEVSANPFSPPVYRQIDPIPGTIPPEIKLISPRNNTNYTDNVTVTLNVVKPQLSKWDSSITEIVYKLDQADFKPLYNVRNEKTTSGIPGISEYQTTFSLPYYSGNHTITIRVIGAVVDSPTRTMFYVDSSSTVSFTMNNQTPSPTSTVPEFPLIGVLCVLAVASFSMVYFKRRKGKP